MAEQKRFQVEIDGTVTIVRLSDPALSDFILISELHDELLTFIAQCEPRHLVVDFSRVTHCSSAVINAVLRARNRLREGGGNIKLCGMRYSVRDAFRTLNLDGTVFEIHGSLQEAVDAFA
jgi:anti-anti-sigma factor